MRYLLDSLQSFENDHADALYPGNVNNSDTYLGEGELHQPVTRAGLRADLQSMFAAVKVTCPIQSAVPQHAVGNGYGLPTTTTTVMAAASRQMTPAGPQLVVSPGPVIPPVAAAIAMQSVPVGIEPIPKTSQHVQSERAPLTTCHQQVSTPSWAIYIPNLSRSFHAWREAIHQWDEGVPEVGIPPLRDWDRALYTKAMREKIGMKRRTREIIAYEYNR